MFKLKVGNNEFSGELHSIEFEGDVLVLKFKIADTVIETIDVHLPKFPEDIKLLITSMGFNRFKESVLNMNTGTVETGNSIL